MDTKVGIAVIIGVCVLILLIGIVKKKAEILLNFATRAVVCSIAAYFVNTFLAAHGLDAAIGFNLISLLTFGSLGFSGMAALYGILLLQIL